MYTYGVPKLWNKTIEAHRRSVHQATLDTTAALVAAHGLASLTMSQIAEKTGIGRGTLYKYFPDVEAILVAWHERHVARHLQHLAEVRDGIRDPNERLEAVLEAYAIISYQLAGHAGAKLGSHATDVATLLHRGKHVARANQDLRNLVRDLLIESARSGHIRDDVAPEELAAYCLHALTAAGNLASEAAVRRLVKVTLAGLRPATGRRSKA